MSISLALAASAALALAPGAWHITDQVSDLDGAHRFLAAIESTDELAGFTDAPKKAALRVRCERGELAVDLLWPDFTTDLGSWARIHWRVDDGRVQVSEMLRDTTSFSSAGPEAQKLLGLWRGAKLTVRAPDQHGNQDASFDISGIDLITRHAAAAGCR
jgi:hypothetical protein